MKNKIKLEEAGKRDKKEIIQTSFIFDKIEYARFKRILKVFNAKVTDIFKEFMGQVNEVYDNGGGEIAFIIEKKEGGLVKK